MHLFAFLASVAVGTFIGGPLGDHFGRKYVIWFSILGALPFTLLMPHADLIWTGILSVVIGVVISSAFSAIVVYGQELLPGKVGLVSGLFFGFSFGMAGLGAAGLGRIADLTSIGFVYLICSFLPLLGFFAAFLPNIEAVRARAEGQRQQRAQWGRVERIKHQRDGEERTQEGCRHGEPPAYGFSRIISHSLTFHFSFPRRERDKVDRLWLIARYPQARFFVSHQRGRV